MGYSNSDDELVEGMDTEYKQLISIFDGIDEGFYVSDPDSYGILYANKVMRNTFGDIQGEKCYKAIQGLDAPCPFCTNDRIFGENLGRRYFWDFQNKINQRWYHCVDKAIKWPDGRWVRYEMAIDITDQKLAEEELRKHQFYLVNLVEERTSELIKVNEQLKQEVAEHREKAARVLRLDRILKSIMAINRLIIYERDRYNLLQSTCDILTEVNEYQMVWIGFLEEEYHRVVPVAYSGVEEGYLESVKITWDDSPTAQGPTGTAIKSRRPSIMRDIHKDPQYKLWREPALQRGYRSSIAIPLMANEELYGVLNIYSTKSGAFDQEELELLTHVADDIAFALDKVKSEEERKQIEEDRARLQRRLEALWKIAQIIDESHRSLCDHVLNEMTAISHSPYAFYGFLNEAESIMNIYSWSKEVMDTCRIQDKPIRFPITTAGLWADAVRLRRPLIINDYPSHPQKKGLPDGHVQLTRVMAVPVFRFGRIIAVAAVANKPTDYTQADAKQIESFATNVQIILDHRRVEDELKRFSTAVRMSSDLIIITDTGGNITDVNDAALKLLEMGREKLIEKNFTDIIASEDHKKAITGFEGVMRSNVAEKQEYAIITKNGDRIILEANTATMNSNEGELLGFVVIARDITNRKRAEKEMRRQLLKFKLEEGEIYLEKEKYPIKSLEAFNDTVKVGFTGFIISRTPKNKFKSSIENHFDYLWIAEKGDLNAVSPDITDIELEIENSKNNAILIDGLHYLISKNGFEDTLTFVQHLREIAYLKNLIIILSVDPSTMNEREMRLLEKEASEVESRYMAKLPDDLLKILKIIYTQNKVGSKPTYTEVEREIGVSKPTARRRIRTLVSYGYMIEITKGRFKLLELTEKGRNLFTG
ncbi:MAG: GAF domain-containing protein [Archaeoglobaceae archaeon]